MEDLEQIIREGYWREHSIYTEYVDNDTSTNLYYKSITLYVMLWMKGFEIPEEYKEDIMNALTECAYGECEVTLDDLESFMKEHEEFTKKFTEELPTEPSNNAGMFVKIDDKLCYKTNDYELIRAIENGVVAEELVDRLRKWLKEELSAHSVDIDDFIKLLSVCKDIAEHLEKQQ